jgi:hypothetical protein
VGCVDESEPAFPVTPGGGSAGPSDQAGGSGNAQSLRGRVCVLDDLFTSNGCSNTDAGGLTVSLGDQTTTTNENGTFSMQASFGSNLSFLVSGPDVVTTSQGLTPSMQIPVLRQATFDAMMTANGITTTAGTGSIFATLMRGGQPVQGAAATSTPSPAFGPFFDGTQPTPWTLDATGARGVVWFPGVTVGPADLTFNTLTGGESIVGGVQVINGGVTMVETVLP